MPSPPTDPGRSGRPAHARLGLPWPLPALLAWGAAWALFLALRAAGLPGAVCLALAAGAGIACSPLGRTWWRRGWIAAGFPLSLLASGAGGGLPAWAWLLPLGLLLLVYPLNAWRDAPVFPTPRDALRDLPARLELPEGAGVLDAGCGLGHGLAALRGAYPDALLHGIERSLLLRWVCALRCPWATVRQGDIWRADWARYDLVYLFQRPESMPRAIAKARAEMRPGSWLVSLEFPVAELPATLRVDTPDGRPVWAYRL